MASRLFTELIFKLAVPIAAAIRKGRLAFTLLGAIAGAGVGATIGFLEISLLAFGSALGAIAGAATLAVAFPKPVPEPAVSDESRSPGGIRGSWFAPLGDNFWILTVLLERAVYQAAVSDEARCRSLLKEVERGACPRPSGSELVFLEDLEHVDFAEAGGANLTLAARRGGQFITTIVAFTHAEQRDEFIGALEEHFGQSFLRTERPLDPLTAGTYPLMALAAVVLVFGGAAGLSSYWMTNPPQPPRDKPQGDALVLFLRSTGPQNILLAGLVLALLCLAWLGYHLLRPPTLLRLSRTAEPEGK